VRQKIQEAFEEADIDGDGVLNRKQLTMLMRKMKIDILQEDEDPRDAAVDWVMELAAGGLTRQPHQSIHHHQSSSFSAAQLEHLRGSLS